MKPITKILVPIDFSETSKEAIRTGAELARHFGASLTLAHVQEPIHLMVPDGYAFFAPGQLEQIRADLEKALVAEKQVAEAAGMLQAQTRMVDGVASFSIVELARKEGFDLIVMGTHGRTGLKHALLGSVAERVLRNAHCPVLTVKAQEPAHVA